MVGSCSILLFHRLREFSICPFKWTRCSIFIPYNIWVCISVDCWSLVCTAFGFGSYCCCSFFFLLFFSFTFRSVRTSIRSVLWFLPAVECDGLFSVCHNVKPFGKMCKTHIHCRFSFILFSFNIIRSYFFFFFIVCRIHPCLLMFVLFYYFVCYVLLCVVYV